MRHLAIEVGSRRFVARLEEEAAPKTCAAFLKMLPFSNQVIHSRWSGEAVWVPLADFDTGLDFENHTSHPSRGDVLLYHIVEACLIPLHLVRVLYLDPCKRDACALHTILFCDLYHASMPPDPVFLFYTI